MNASQIEKYMNLRDLSDNREQITLTQSPNFNKLIEEARNAGFEARKLNQHAMVIKDLDFPDQLYYISKKENVLNIYPEGEDNFGPEFVFIEKVNQMLKDHLEKETKIQQYSTQSTQLTNDFTISDYTNQLMAEAMLMKEMNNVDVHENAEIRLLDEKGKKTIALRVEKENNDMSFSIDYLDKTVDKFKITEKDIKDWENGNFELSNLNMQVNQKLNYYKNIYEQSGKEMILKDVEEKQPFTCSVGWIEKAGQTIEKGLDLTSEFVSPIVGVAQNIKQFAMETITTFDNSKEEDSFLAKNALSGVEILGKESRDNFAVGFRDGYSYEKEVHDVKKMLKEASQKYGENTLEKYELINNIKLKASHDKILENATMYAALGRKLGHQIAVINNTIEDVKEFMSKKKDDFLQSKFMNKANNLIQTYIDNAKNTFKEMVKTGKELCLSIKENSKLMLETGMMNKDKLLVDLSNQQSKVANELGKNLNAIHLNGQEKFNDFIKDTKLILNAQEFSKTAIAEIMHDERRKSLIKNVVEEFVPSVMQAQPTWKEQEYILKEAKNITKGDGDFESDLKTMDLANKVRKQREIDLFVGESMSNKIKDIMNSNMNLESATNELAKTYHNSMLKAKIAQGDIDINVAKESEYSKLSEDDKFVCQEIAYNTIKQIEPLKDRLDRNEKLNERTEQFNEKYNQKEIDTFNEKDFL